MSRSSTIYNIFAFWSATAAKYERLKKDEQKRERSVSLGVQAIVQSLVSAALIALCIWGLASCIMSLSDSGLSFILLIVAIVVLAAAAVSLFTSGLLGSLLYVIYQLKLNRRAVGKAALAVWIISVLLMIGLCVLLIVIF